MPDKRDGEAVARRDALDGAAGAANQPAKRRAQGADVDDVVSNLLVKVRQYGKNTASLKETRTRIRSRFERAG